MEEFLRWIEKKNIIARLASASNSYMWLHEGLEIKESFVQLVEKEFKALKYLKVEMPFFIDRKIYEKQKEHFEGLKPYTFRINNFQNSNFSYLRTTSETIFTEFFKHKIEANPKYANRYFQVVTVFRNENEETPLFRGIEINPFIESYSIFHGEKESLRQISTDISIYENILQKLSVKYIISRRPKFDTFPEARYTIAFDVLLPNLELFQIATVHDLGDSFTRAFNIPTYKKIPYLQTSTGISSRAIGCSLFIHKHDDHLVLPLDISPYQFLIKREEENFITTCLLQKKINPQNIYYEKDCWFEEGGCFIMEENNSFVRIQTLFKGTIEVPKTHFSIEIDKIIKSFQQGLFKKSETFMDNHTYNTTILQTNSNPGIYRLSYCGNEDCLKNVNAKYFQVLGINYKEIKKGFCFNCHKKSNYILNIYKKTRIL